MAQGSGSSAPSSARKNARYALDLKALVSLRRTLAATILITAGGAYQFSQVAFEIGVIPSSWKWTLALAVGVLSVIAGIMLLMATWTQRQGDILRSLEMIRGILSRGRTLNLLGFFFSLGFFPALIMGSYGQFFEDFLLRLFVLWILALLGATFLQVSFPQRTWSEFLPLSLFLYTISYRSAHFIPLISTYPFSLGYSEGSRFYFASLFFSKKIYGKSGLTLPMLHPSRYLLQSIPFLISRSPLVVHRLWQVFLWIGMTFASAAVVIRRLSIQDRFRRVLWLGWLFLFVFQGPVYYHLLLMVVLVLWTADSQRFMKTILVVVLASVWAGISRLNWVPVPGLLAATIYLLEQRKLEGISIWRYMLKPLLWVGVGSLVAFGSYFVYGALSRNAIDWISTIQSSPLLWYRLLPNATFETGVLPAILLVSVPLLLVIYGTTLRRPIRWHPIRLLALTSIMGVLFFGGLFVSVKIGGGGDLHNMDAFLIHLMLIGSYFLFNVSVSDQPSKIPIGTPSWWLTAWVMAMPVFFALNFGGPVAYPDSKKGEVALVQLQEAVDEIVDQGGEVLFLSERHLLTFHLIEGVDLLPQHEKTFLMEMAMSDNQEYFAEFNAELQSGRYPLIVSPPQHRIIHGQDYIFGDEDDAWVGHVGVSLLEYYETMMVLDSGSNDIALMKPKR